MKSQIIEMLTGAIPEAVSKLQSITKEDLKQLSGTELIELESFLCFLDDIIPSPE